MSSGAAHAAERRLHLEDRAQRRERRRHRGLDPARRDRVDADLAGRELARERAREAEDARLRGAVAGHAGAARGAHDRAHVDDRARELRRHDAQRLARAEEGAVEVHREHAVPLGVGGFERDVDVGLDGAGRGALLHLRRAWRSRSARRATGSLSWPAMPALLTSTSRRPWRAATASNMRATAPESATSAANDQPPTSLATRSARAASRSLTTSDAPSARKRRAIASPRPAPPPVTSAILPERRDVIESPQSPARLQPQIESHKRMVRQRGLEPPRGCPRQPLKLVRLPISPLPQSRGAENDNEASCADSAARQGFAAPPSAGARCCRRGAAGAFASGALASGWRAPPASLPRSHRRGRRALRPLRPASRRPPVRAAAGLALEDVARCRSLFAR